MGIEPTLVEVLADALWDDAGWLGGVIVTLGAVVGECSDSGAS